MQVLMVLLLLTLSAHGQADPNRNLSQSARDYLDDFGGQVGARGPAPFFESFWTNWEAAALDTITGSGKPLADARSELSAAIEAASGKPIGQYAAEQRIPLGAGTTIEQNIKALNDLADTLPKDAQKTVDALRDVRRRADEKQISIRRAALDTRYASYDFVATAPWLAIFLRHAIEPYGWAVAIVLAIMGKSWRRWLPRLIYFLRFYSPSAIFDRLLRVSANVAVRWDH